MSFSCDLRTKNKQCDVYPAFSTPVTYACRNRSATQEKDIVTLIVNIFNKKAIICTFISGSLGYVIPRRRRRVKSTRLEIIRCWLAIRTTTWNQLSFFFYWYDYSEDAGRSGDEMKHAACVVAVSRLRGPAFNPWCPPAATSPFKSFLVILFTSSLRWVVQPS